ncbi:copper chaperone PCu(A)C [Noviherbaspirillum sp. ST9]|uniref:copper chaperone PCu(A)C n=1 Tax=Noviherbaspirillum sp. ST9 TaxID=3401606 RepID=UPI003B589D8D
MFLRPFTALTMAFTFSLPAHAQETKLKDLLIDNPFARATVANQRTGGAYVTIENKGKNADKLVGASSPVAKSVEIHTMSMDGNVMKMREVGQIDIPASGRVEMKPGDGFHLMLMGLQQPLKAGDSFPMTLVFEKAGKTEVKVKVQEKKDAGHGGMHHGH